MTSVKPKSLYIAGNFDPERRAEVDAAQSALERVLRDAADRVEVRWEPATDDAGERVTRLTISDTGVSKSYDFYNFEFRESLHVRRKLRALWDEVLTERISQLRERIDTSLAQTEGA